MRLPSTTRHVGSVVLVATAVLGTAFAAGRSLAPETRQRQTATVVAETPSATGAARPSQEPPHYADQPAPTTPPPVPPLPLGTGPFGTRTTTGTPRVALTFDDGPDPRYTPQTLSLLRSYRVKATFCLVGHLVQTHPDLVRRIVAEGHTLCNHSWRHDVLLGSRTHQAIRADLLRTNAAIRAAVPNARVAYYRQPGGRWTYPVAAVARELGMSTLHWAVDPRDWQRPGAATIATRVISATVAGSIVLLHDAGGNRSGTVTALRTILPTLSRRFQLAALPTGAT